MADLITALFLIFIASYVIKYTADQFDPAANYLGRSMPPGVLGATYKAIGSSLPELMTGIAFIFTVSSLSVADGFLSAVAVTAGSAVFNILIIPALVILFAMFKNKGTHIQVDRGTMIRDGVFLIISNLLLIVLLGDPVLTWKAGALLVGLYFVYFGYLMYQNYVHQIQNPPEPNYGAGGDVRIIAGVGSPWVVHESRDEELKSSFWTSVFTFDFHKLVFGGQEMTTKMAWSLLGLSVFVMGLACHFLAESVVMAADALGVHAYITAVIFGAAATSIPDTILSVKDALKLQVANAISNAVGSNIFDITICTGIPLLLYTVIFGSMDLELTGALDQQVQLLRIVLLGVSAAVIGMFLVGKEMGRGKAYMMLAMYVAWITWIIVTAIGGTP